ncbi:(5-formylfuran-3-yl)methyl phosphate synthase [Ramlibacter sp. USB13]|uniref:(5-formylfuran-3-yl)methyl phosphate synthase n=1 Tax=Ramlibacter cellulosilyticus TaxID=2764187 RepID=A0A923S9Z6_9BURK|nr:(5-formylfuran-3-yl)methyl phosphate synthase [Ramlibacter cellulosilyticus]MBC5782229.1 (5-formylfuran-3-yl)methyl phosphate synthase [Ramlibacter cellulosilyticus]
MVRLLASVRDVDEAVAAATAGADFIDLKEPADGALGAVAPEAIARIVSVLRARHPGVRISATVGDLPAHEVDEILARVRRVEACGVDYVKVGVWPSPSPGPVHALLEALAQQGGDVVPVLLVDAGLDESLVRHALAGTAFPAVMLDTTEKRRGSLLQRVPLATLAGFVATVRAHGRMVGLAGSLRVDDVPTLVALDPDFAGFRRALARYGRAGTLDPRLVRRLRRALAAHADAPLPAGA